MGNFFWLSSVSFLLYRFSIKAPALDSIPANGLVTSSDPAVSLSLKSNKESANCVSVTTVSGIWVTVTSSWISYVCSSPITITSASTGFSNLFFIDWSNCLDWSSISMFWSSVLLILSFTLLSSARTPRALLASLTNKLASVLVSSPARYLYLVFAQNFQILITDGEDLHRIEQSDLRTILSCESDNSLPSAIIIEPLHKFT